LATPLSDLPTSRRRVLITGGSGFIGANLARRLINDEHEVHLLLSSGRPAWRLHTIGGRYVAHHIDLRDALGVEGAVGRIRPDWIFHLATYGAYPYQNEFDKALAVNVVATMGLVRAALRQGFESLVLAGTSSEYGSKDHPPDEGEGLNPSSYYAATKAAATILSRQLAAAHAANIVTLRLYSIYGPFEEPTRLIPAIIESSWHNQLPPLVSPESAHDFVFVDDAVEAFVRCAVQTDHVPGAIYNVSTGTQVTLREVVDVARQVLKVTVEPNWGSMPARSWDTASWRGTSRALREHTGWQPHHEFAAGLRKTAEWFESEPGMKAHYGAALNVSR
jgi:nucleoside-diphosphate-sugar epimerase